MSQYYFDEDVLVSKKPKTESESEKEFAEALLASEGYKPVTKPRRVNGGRDSVSAKHTEKNKARLNSTLAKAPLQARAESAKVSVKKKKKKAEIASGVVRTQREKAATPFPIAYVFYIGILTLIIVYVVHLYIEIADLDATLSEYNSTLIELKSEQNDLEFQKNKLYNLEEIERIAREQYGMVSADQLPKEYITPDKEDHIQILDTGEDESAAGVLMSGFGRTVTNLLSYIN